MVVDQIIKLLDTNYSTPGHAIKNCNTDTVDSLLFELSSVDFVVASRLHGILISHMLCKPVLALSYDKKVDVYMREMGHARYCLDISKADSNELSNIFNMIVSERDQMVLDIHKNSISNNDILRVQYDDVLSFT